MSSPSEDGEIRELRWRTPATPATPQPSAPHARDYAALQTRLRHAYLFTPLREGERSNTSGTASTRAPASDADAKPKREPGEIAPASSRAVDFRRVPQQPGHHYHGGGGQRPHRPDEFPINLFGNKDGRATCLKYHTVPSQRIGALKRWMHFKFGYALEDLRLVYDGRVLRDWDTMEQLGVEAGDSFDIYLEQVGG